MTPPVDVESSTTSPLPAFASGFALRAADTAWLIGAGASAESAVPTASQLIDLLVVELYCRDHGIKNDDLLTNDRWRDLVYPLYSGQGGLPAIDDDAFYSAIFERVYPDPEARARFVMDKLGGKRPNHGQHQLAAMVAQRHAALVVTTNFDTLLEDSIREMLAHADTHDRLTVLEPQNSGRANFAHASNQHPVLVKIHGDYGAVTLSNTEAELAHHDPELRDLVTAQLSRFGLIVAGYSGRDPAVMKMLTDVLSHPKPYPAGLTWVRRPENPLSTQARRLLHTASDAGVSPIHEVVAGGFGELMSALARPLTFDPPVQHRLDQLKPPPVRVAAKRPTGSTQRYPQIRFGAVELTGLPSQARSLASTEHASLTQIRKLLRDSRVRATVGFASARLAAFGPDTAISAALSPLDVVASTEVVPIVPLRDGRPSSAEVGMLTEALAQGLGRTPGLTAVMRTGHRPMVRVQTPANVGAERSTPGVEALRDAVRGPVAGVIKGSDGAVLPWAEAVTISIEYVDGRWLVLFAPDMWVRPTFVDAKGQSTGTKDAADRAGGDFARTRLAPRYNRQAGAILDAWLALLAGGGSRTINAFAVAPADGIDATFNVAGKPVVSCRLAGGTIPVNQAGIGR